MKSELDRAYNENIGAKIHEEMKRNHISLDELSQKMEYSIPKPTLARYVRGENAIPDKRLQSICNALGIDYLLLKQWAVSKSTDTSRSDQINSIDGNITAKETLLIRYYRSSDQSRQKAARIILGMDE